MSSSPSPLAIAWIVLLVPLLAFAWYAAFRNGMPDVKALPPLAMAAFGLLAIGLLLAVFSISVNWNRRILLGERPRRLAWVRLDGAVWRLMLGHVLLIVALGLYAGAAFSAIAFAAPALAGTLGAAAKPIAIVIALLLGLSGLFTLYRLASWLAGISVADTDYTLRTAWRRTAKNRIAYLSFTFWLLFTLAIAGGMGRWCLLCPAKHGPAMGKACGLWLHRRSRLARAPPAGQRGCLPLPETLLIRQRVENNTFFG